MRASTLFGITIAGLLGLGVVVGAKMTGFFDRQPSGPPEPPPPKILVAKLNLFEGNTILGTDVAVRDLRADEVADFNANKGKYLPATPNAAHQRILTKSVPADTPLLKDHFSELDLPSSIGRRLSPGMRAIDLTLPKEQAAGGMIQKEEVVDVFLTTLITCPEGNCASPATRTAAIARNLKVIAKRGNLWTVMQPINPNAPTQYTLEANPYRAALIEFARMHGQVALVPTAAERPTGGSDPKADPIEQGYEKLRSEQLLSGELIIGEADLERIFHLRPLPKTPPPLKIERFDGITPKGSYVYNSAGAETPESTGVIPASDNRALMGYQFWIPQNYTGTANTGGKANCPTCGDNAKGGQPPR